MFQLGLPFEKGALFQHFFLSFFGCEILITMHSLNWWNQNYLGAPTIRSEGGENSHRYKIGWAAQIGGYITNTHTHTHTHQKTKQNKTNKQTKNQKKRKKKLQDAPHSIVSKKQQQQKSSKIPITTITLLKRCPFPTLFSLFDCKILITIMMHSKNWWYQNYWVPLLICKIYWDASPNLVDFTQKVCKHGSIMTPNKNPKTWVKLVVKCWQLTIFDKVLTQFWKTFL